MAAEPTGAGNLPAVLAGPTRHLFLSPHYDDIAISCGGTAALLARAGFTPEVALIFGAEPDPAAPLTPFAARMHEGWGLDASGVIAARRAEEAAAAAALGTTPRFLPFHDAIYRGDRYLGPDQLFGQTAADEADLPDRLVAALALPQAPHPGARVYAPLGIGGHVDHQHAFTAGVRLARAGWNVWFYEDLPYALRPGSREERFARAGVALTLAALVPVAATWQAKLDAIMAYPSQLATVFAYVGSGASRAEIDAAMRAYATEAGGGEPAERFWAMAGS